MGEVVNQGVVIRQRIHVCKSRGIEHLTQNFKRDDVVRVVVKVMIERPGMPLDYGGNAVYPWRASNALNAVCTAF
jgi:hypothetical protein